LIGAAKTVLYKSSRRCFARPKYCRLVLAIELPTHGQATAQTSPAARYERPGATVAWLATTALKVISSIPRISRSALLIELFD